MLFIQMAHFGHAIQRLREQKLHLTQGEFGKLIGADAPRVSKIEKKSSASISQKTYRKLAAAFGMTVEELDAEWRATRIVRTIGGPGIPVINRTPAGNVVDYHELGVDSGQGRFYIDRGGIADQSAFAAIITGDSMADLLQEGDYAIFVPLRQDGRTATSRIPIKDGHVVHVRFSAEHKGDGCTVAMVYRLSDGRIELRKYNRKYAPMVVRTQEIQSMAAMVQSRRNWVEGIITEYDAFSDHGKNSEGDV